MRLLSFIIFFFFLYSCNSSKDKTEVFYNDHKIAMVIADLYLTGQILDDVPERLRDSLRVVYREQVATIHKVDMDLMEQDIEKVQRDPSRYLVIHKMVKDSISAYEASYKKSK